MIKKTFVPLLTALVCVGAMAFAPAQAKKDEKPPAVRCTDSNAFTGACDGPFDENIQKDEQVTFGDSKFMLAGATKFDDPFIEAPDDDDAGTLKFLFPVTGHFLIGIKAGNSVSLYLFDGGEEGLDAIEFDTLGVSSKGKDDKPEKMNHAFLFTPDGLLPQARTSAGGDDGGEEVTAPPTAQQVPEPASGALAVLALAAAGLAARRRRSP